MKDFSLTIEEMFFLMVKKYQIVVDISNIFIYVNLPATT